MSSISSIGSSQYRPQMEQSAKMTDDEKKKLQDIISKYDASSITQDEQKTMMDEIKSAGIKPSKELGETLNEAGFKRPEKPKDAPDSQQSSSSVSQDELKNLLDLLSNKGTTDVDQSEIDSFIQNLKNLTDSNEGTLIDQKD